MANYNIRMSYFNGSSYDTLYPETTYSNISGSVPSSDLPTIPLTKGGTGGTSASDGLGNLINGATTVSSLADGDYIGIRDVSASSGRKITIANLVSYISQSSSSSISTGSFRPTSRNNFSFAVPNPNFKVIFILRSSEGSSYYLSIFAIGYSQIFVGGSFTKNANTTYGTMGSYSVSGSTVSISVEDDDFFRVSESYKYCIIG